MSINDFLEIIKEKILFSFNIFSISVSIKNVTISFIVTNLFFLIIRIMYGQNHIITNIVDNLFVFIEKECMKYLHANNSITVSFFLTIFIFISFMNILGSIGFYPVTANPLLVFQLSCFIFFIYLIVALYQKSYRFFWEIVPSSIPALIKPWVIILEFISILIKPIAMSIRLALNMFIGHLCVLILQILSTNSSGMYFLSVFIAVFIKLIEFIVCVLQAYIFTLMCILLFATINSH